MGVRTSTILRLKQTLVGTALGRKIMRCRQLWELWKAVRSNPEGGPMASQNACAQILLRQLRSSSAVFVDVGAHIGSVITEVSHYNPSVRIIAIEPVPEKASYLAQKFGQVEVHNCVVGESQGEVKFFIDLKRPGFSSLAEIKGSKGAVIEITVMMRRLDDIIADSANVDVVKIDVEGAELGVLRGASNLISRCRPVILFESSPQRGEPLGYSIQELYDWFAIRDYETLVPNRVAHNGPALSQEGFIEAHFYPRRTLNYFAVPAERRIEIRDRARKALGIV